MQKLKTQKGITLIALIITIIVMLILVGVSVTVALNGGLFRTAERAADRTEEERDIELERAEGKVEVGGVAYNSVEDYLNNPKLPEGWEIQTDEKRAKAWPKETVKNERVIAITDGTNTIPLPKGFQVSLEKGESTVSKGLVVKDGENEFVWVPVKNSGSYTESDLVKITENFTYNNKVIGMLDSYQMIQFLYGDLFGTMTSVTNFDETFTYTKDKSYIEKSIRTYGGFYVGRYETTYDSTDEGGIPQGIGVKQGKNVLKATNIMKTGTNTTINSKYVYRWWGLYKAQKDMYADNPNVGSLMITGGQWDEIMTFIGTYKNTTRTTDTYTNYLSGSAYSTDSTKYDEANNIYDLAGNFHEWTLSIWGTKKRNARGGSPSMVRTTNFSNGWDPWAGNANWVGSRVALYIR